jgi:hypothetical protein
MTDMLQDDPRFERDLRAVLADLAPDAAPGSLRTAVAGVPGRPVVRAHGGTRMLLSAIGLAAVVVIAIAGIGLVGGGLPVGPAVAPPTGGAPSAVASPSAAAVSLTFRVVTPDGSMATKDQVLAVEDVMTARLQAYGIGTFSSSGSDDRITFEMTLPSTDPTSRTSLRELLGATGAVSMVLLGADPVNPGDQVTGAPLFTGAAVTDARVGSDQAGTPTLDLALDDPAAAALAGATRTHVGEYLAVVLDGRAVSTPVINGEITDGRVQISFAGDDTTPARLAAILQAGLAHRTPGTYTGTLPLPVETVTP